MRQRMQGKNPRYNDHKAWRERNPEYARIWRKNNHEKVREYQRNWRKNNHEKVLAARALWLANRNPERRERDKQYHREWAAKNRMKCLEKVLRYKQRNLEKVRKSDSINQIKYKYGISAEGYVEMARRQGNRCAICGVHQDKLKRRLAVDHDHSNGKVRGLLCAPCNCSLGALKENVSTFQRMIDYIRLGGFKDSTA